MITVIVPVIVLIVLIMVKKIPFVGGKVTYALIIAGLLALLMGGVFNPLQWVLAWIDGIDKLAWIMALNIFGSIYAASQTEMKTLDLVLNVARVSLGRSPTDSVMAQSGYLSRMALTTSSRRSSSYQGSSPPWSTKVRNPRP